MWLRSMSYSHWRQLDGTVADMYRDETPRTTATDLFEERRRTRAAYDEAARLADELGPRLAKAEQAGRATDALRAEHLALTTRIEALASAEKMIDAKLSKLAASQSERVARADALLELDGLAGETVRALDAAARTTDEQLAALEIVIATCDRTARDVDMLVEILRDEKASGGIGMAILKIAIDGPLVPSDRQLANSRKREFAPTVRRSIADMVCDLGGRGLDEQLLQLSSLASDDATMIAGAAAAASCIDGIVSELVSKRAALRKHRGALAGQYAALG